MDHLANRCTVIGSAPHAGVFSGRARIIWNDGDIFEGFLRENQLVVGEMSYAGGDVYRGDYLHGLMHGQGSYFYFDGRVHVGEYRDGKRHGYGELSDSAAGTSYRGGFREDLREGYGEQMFGVHHKFCGQFVADEISGYGSMTYPDGTSHWGQWKTVMERPMLRDGLAIYVQADGHRLLERYKNGKVIDARAMPRSHDEAYLLARCKTPPVWQDDSSAEECFLCGKFFSLTVRRSHCRSCGLVVCSECVRPMQLPWKSKPSSKVCEDCIIIRNVLFQNET